MKALMTSLACCLTLSLALFAGCGSSGGGGGGASTTIGAAGGTAASSDGKFTLVVPAGALASDAQITISPMGNDLLDVLLASVADFGANYELTPDGLAFALPATGTLTLTQADAAAMLQNGALTSGMLATEETGALAFLDNAWTSVDQTTGEYTVQGEVNHFSCVTASNGLVGISVDPAGVIAGVGDTVNIAVTLTGRTSFNFGNYGQIDEVRIKDAMLKALPPPMGSVNPAAAAIYYPDGGVPTVTQTFAITCDAAGDDVASFYLDKPQVYALSGATDYTNNSQFGVTIPVVCESTGDDDDESGSYFTVIRMAPSTPVGEEATYQTLVYFHEVPTGNVSLTATVADPTIAGTSPQTVDPYGIKAYTTNKQLLEFECYKGGLTSATFVLTASDVPYRDADFNRLYKDLTLTATRELVCSETVPAPSGVTVDDTVSCQLTVSWAYTDTYAADGFAIERVKTPATDWTEIATVAGDKRAYVNAHATDPSLELGATYCYRIRAYKDVSGAGRVYSDYSADVGCGTKQ